MEIVKMGKINMSEDIRQFTCRHCGTIFKATKFEYNTASMLEYMHDGIQYTCECPVCKREATIPT